MFLLTWHGLYKMSHVHAAPVGGSPPPTEDIPHPGSVESLVAALGASGVRSLLWDVFFFFCAVVAILRLDHFFKRVIDRYASYLR
jgi:hypothetical protein